MDSSLTSIATALDTPLPKQGAALFLFQVQVGYHVGIIFTNGDGAADYLHMGVEGILYQYRHAQCYPQIVVDPDMEALRLQTVARKCEMIRDRCLEEMSPFAQDVPFSFAQGASIIVNEGGVIDVRAQGDTGFTCATFVLAVFESVGLAIIDLKTVVDDQEATSNYRDRLITFLETHRIRGEILGRLRRTSGHPRIAAECVAAAVTEGPFPVPYGTAEERAPHIVQRLAGEVGEEAYRRAT